MVQIELMKTALALTTLSVKLVMLLCVSGMGLFGIVPNVLAEALPPCHQKMAQTASTQGACETCQTALTAWDTKAVATSKVTLTEVTERALDVDSLVETFALNLQPLAGIYEAYYPPPQVLLKAVTPNTKTIVLLS